MVCGFAGQPGNSTSFGCATVSTLTSRRLSQNMCVYELQAFGSGGVEGRELGGRKIRRGLYIDAGDNKKSAYVTAQNTVRKTNVSFMNPTKEDDCCVNGHTTANLDRARRRFAFPLI